MYSVVVCESFWIEFPGLVFVCLLTQKENKGLSIGRQGKRWIDNWKQMDEPWICEWEKCVQDGWGIAVQVYSSGTSLTIV